METVQSLWSDYGEIARYYSPARKQNYIVKIIDICTQGKHPRGWQSDISHQRKLDSYQNEQRFYQRYAHNTHSLCAVPKTYDSGQNKQFIWIIMEDLDARGLHARYLHANIPLARLGVAWLAHFHACFMQQALSSLWPVGTYWHLATRPKEWQTMPSGELKSAAQKIDDVLNQAQFQTLLHGDAKLANFCFSSNGDELAAVDFQYTGRGVGVKDLVYFLGSCFNEDELAKNADALYQYYFAVLTRALSQNTAIQENHDIALIEAQWRELIPFAWADFERFLSGWAPEHKKLNAYSRQQTLLALAQINAS